MELQLFFVLVSDDGKIRVGARVTRHKLNFELLIWAYLHMCWCVNLLVDMEKLYRLASRRWVVQPIMRLT